MTLFTRPRLRDVVVYGKGVLVWNTDTMRIYIC